MNRDIVLAGVGGQGVVTVAALIAEAGRREGLVVKQGEVHGMAQRGGAVQANLRLSDEVIDSDLIPRGAADLIISMEPIESLRYVEFLSLKGTLITSVDPFTNLPNYPDVEEVLEQVRSLPRAVTVDAERLARQAGSVRAKNVVMIGAASQHLPIAAETLETCIREAFARKGERNVEINIDAFQLGRDAAAPALA